MALTNKEVAEITGDTEEEIARITKEDGIDASIKNTSQLPSTDVMKISTDGAVCDVCGQEFTGVMAKAQLGRHKSAKHGIKSASAKEKGTAITSEQAKTEIPTTETYLATVLRAFSVPNQPGILLSMQNNPDDIPRLKDMLRAVALPNQKIEAVITLYREYLGVPSKSVDAETPSSQQSPLKQTLSTLSDTIALQSLQKIAGGGGHESSEVASLKLQLAEMKDMLLRQKSDDELKLLKEELKKSKEETEGHMGSVASALKEYITEDRHKWEMFQKDQAYSAELKAIREALQASQSGASLTLGEKMLNKGEALADKVLGGVGKFNADIINRTVANDVMEQAQRLRAMGFQPSEITQLVTATAPRPKIVNAEADHVNLQKEYQMLEKATAQPPQPKTMEEITAEHFKAMPPLKMNVEQ